METVAQAAERYRLAAEKHMPAKVEKSSGFRIAFARCESPIEQAFCLALFQVPGVFAIEGNFRPELAAHRPKTRGVLVFAQNPIKRYRADFLLVALSPIRAEPAFLIVECDGEAFHSAAEDVIRDEAREQELRSTGFRIARHTGSEIHQGPSSVIDKTMACLTSHGWGKAEGKAWVNEAIIRRAMAAMSDGESEQNPMMGWRPHTFKPAPVGQVIGKAFARFATDPAQLARRRERETA